MLRQMVLVLLSLMLVGCVLTQGAASNMPTASLCAEAAYDSNRDVAFAELAARGVSLENDEQCRLIYLSKMQSFDSGRMSGSMLLIGSDLEL